MASSPLWHWCFSQLLCFLSETSWRVMCEKNDILRWYTSQPCVCPQLQSVYRCDWAAAWAVYLSWPPVLTSQTDPVALLLDRFAKARKGWPVRYVLCLPMWRHTALYRASHCSFSNFGVSLVSTKPQTVSDEPSDDVAHTHTHTHTHTRWTGAWLSFHFHHDRNKKIERVYHDNTCMPCGWHRTSTSTCTAYNTMLSIRCLVNEAPPRRICCALTCLLIGMQCWPAMQGNQCKTCYVPWS